MRAGFVLGLERVDMPYNTRKLLQARWLGGQKFMIKHLGRLRVVYPNELLGESLGYVGMVFSPYFYDGEKYHCLGTNKADVISNIRKFYLNRTNC